MCSHEWKKINDVWVCLRCGITRLPQGIMFDREIVNYQSSKKAKKARRKKK